MEKLRLKGTLFMKRTLLCVSSYRCTVRCRDVGITLSDESGCSSSFSDSVSEKGAVFSILSVTVGAELAALESECGVISKILSGALASSFANIFLEAGLLGGRLGGRFCFILSVLPKDPQLDSSVFSSRHLPGTPLFQQMMLNTL